MEGESAAVACYPAPCELIVEIQLALATPRRKLVELTGVVSREEEVAEPFHVPSNVYAETVSAARIRNADSQLGRRLDVRMEGVPERIRRIGVRPVEVRSDAPLHEVRPKDQRALLGVDEPAA
jgi:hypothetical protein